MQHKHLRLSVFAIALALFIPLAACDRSEGPAERVGEKIDEGAKDTKRTLEDAAD